MPRMTTCRMRKTASWTRLITARRAFKVYGFRSTSVSCPVSEAL